MPSQITHLYLKPKHGQPMQAVPPVTAKHREGF